MYLSTAHILSVSRFPAHGAHPSYLAILEGGVGTLAKPENEVGDGPAMVRREVACWIITREMGWLDLIATTVLREIDTPMGRCAASLQVIWPDVLPDASPNTFDDNDRWRAAVFDAVIAHTDRSGHNWLAVPAQANPPSLKLVDHGYCLGPGIVRPSSTFFDEKEGQVIPEEPRDALRRLRARLPASDIGDLISMEAVDGVVDRAEHLLRAPGLQIP